MSSPNRRIKVGFIGVDEVWDFFCNPSSIEGRAVVVQYLNIPKGCDWEGMRIESGWFEILLTHPLWPEVEDGAEIERFPLTIESGRIGLPTQPRGREFL